MCDKQIKKKSIIIKLFWDLKALNNDQILSNFIFLIHFSGEMWYRKKEHNNIYKKADDIHPRSITKHKSGELEVSKITVNLYEQ